MSKKVFLSILDIPEYVRSMSYIYQRIRRSEADMVLNFYEPLAGLLYGLIPQSIPAVCVGHEYLYLNREIAVETQSLCKLSFLRFLTGITSLGSAKRLALSVEELPSIRESNIKVVPPLLRQEIISLRPDRGDYIHGYLGRADQVRTLMEYHVKHPEIPIHLFRKNNHAPLVREIDPTLFLHQFDEIEYLKYLSGCRISINTGGYEPICETMYLGKPLVIMPGNIIQECNAFFAVGAGEGSIAIDSTHDPLLYLKHSETQHESFVNWVNRSEEIVLAELEEVKERDPLYRTKKIISATS